MDEPYGLRRRDAGRIPLRSIQRRMPCRRNGRLQPKAVWLAVPSRSKSYRQRNVYIENFLFKVCGASGDWTMHNYARQIISDIKARVGNGKALLALSGGVDSSVCAQLMKKAIGKQLTCIFVDHGLMRKNEGNEIEEAFGGGDINFIRVNAEERFLTRLAGVADPEKKRKIIGEEFIRVFEEEQRR